MERRLADLLARFPSSAGPAGDGFWVDEVGVRTRTAYRADYAGRGGHRVAVAAADPVEWLAVLEAVADAQERLTVVELGAGHGPWLARAGVAARVLAPDAQLDLVGVEAEPTHAAWLRDHLDGNGLGAHATAIEAAVAGTGGRGRFEVSAHPESEWGTRLAGAPRPHGMAVVPAPAGEIDVPVLALDDVLADRPWVDLLHVDVQGGELELLTAGADHVRTRVGRLCVGTHGRTVEAGLHELLPALGFRLEADVACVYAQPADELTLVRDGAQYWRSRRGRPPVVDAVRRGGL